MITKSDLLKTTGFTTWLNNRCKTHPNEFKLWNQGWVSYIYKKEPYKYGFVNNKPKRRNNKLLKEECGSWGDYFLSKKECQDNLVKSCKSHIQHLPIENIIVYKNTIWYNDSKDNSYLKISIRQFKCSINVLFCLADEINNFLNIIEQMFLKYT